MATYSLQLPAELVSVPPSVLKPFLSQFSKLLVSQLAPDIPEQRVQAAVNDLFTNVGGNASKPVDVRLEFKHVCKFMGCTLEDCQLCRNNPNKVCDDANCFDHQYWVRDDGKGGQLIKAKCGADVALQLIDRSTNSPVYMADVKLKLYVINGQQLASSGPCDPPGGLYLSDDGHPLFSAAGTAPEDDKGVAIEFCQDDSLGPVGHIPELQFLDKNSKFRVGGRTFKCFKLMARAVKREANGSEVVLSQVESESFKVTTKKGYDGCRKADYLYAPDPITDKTFANLGETTISNLKTNFEGVETVEDLLQLVQACRSAPDMEARLRETLNMARDVEKWRNLIRMLTEKVVWDDSMPRMFVIPAAARPFGLLYRANKGQVDFSSPAGIILSQPTTSLQLRVVRLTDRLIAGASRQVEALRALAAAYWKFMRHPGWALAPDSPVWQDASSAQIVEAFTEVLGQGDPASLVDLHLAALQQAQMAAIAAPLMHAATPASGAVTPQPILNPVTLQGSVGLCSVGLAATSGALNPSRVEAGAWGLIGGVGLGGTVEELAAAAAAPMRGSSGPMSTSGMTAGGAAVSPVVGQLNKGVSGAMYESSVAESVEQSAAAAATGRGFGGTMHHMLSWPAGMRPAAARPAVTTSTHLAAAASAPASAPGTGLSLPTTLPVHQAFGSQNLGSQSLGQSNMNGAGSSQMGMSPFAISLQTGMSPAQSMHAAPSAVLGQVPSAQQQQQQQQFAVSSGGMVGPSVSAGRPSSSCSGLSQGNTLDSQQQQVMAMFGQQQQQQQPSANTLLLQQAIVEGWPAPKVKAVLDLMTDDELQQLVAQEPGTAAGVLARAGGDDMVGFNTMGSGVGAQMVPAFQQQQQQQAAAAYLQHQDQQQHQMPSRLAVSNNAVGTSAGAAAAQVRSAAPSQQHKQQQQQLQPVLGPRGFAINMTVGPNLADDTAAAAAAAPKHTGAESTTQGTASAAAAAALAALFADADGLATGAGGGTGRGMFDVSLTADQMSAAGLLGLSGDSFADPAQWGDILENLRQLSSSSGGPAGAVAGVAGNNPGGSFSTDWIPELLFRLESESKDKEGAAAAAAAPGGSGGAAAAAAAAGGADTSNQAVVSAAADDKATVNSRKAKRERSKTGQAPTAEQLAQLQALFAGDPGQLRSLSKGEAHFGSFNRHFPVARCSSQRQEVHQGAQIANPWNPGQPMSAAGMPASPPDSTTALTRPAITTHAPAVSAAQGNASRMVSAAQMPHNPPTTTTEAGAAAVATVTGLEPLSTVPEAQACSSNELLNALALDDTGGALAVGNSGMATPFLVQCSADEAAAMVHAPTTQRDSSGKAGWISSLFRSGSSWSSKSNSLHGSGSDRALGSVPSHTSRDSSGKTTGADAS